MGNVSAPHAKMILCDGRHEHREIRGLPAIFGNVVDPFDFEGMSKTAAMKLRGIKSLDLYVTGITPAVAVVLNVCMINLIPCCLWHYDRNTDSYVPQEMATACYWPQLHEGGYQ